MQRDVGFHHINYVAGKVDDEAAVNCRVEQTEEGPMLSLMSKLVALGRRGYFGVVQLMRLVESFGEEPRWFEDFYTKEEFGLDLMH